MKQERNTYVHKEFTNYRGQTSVFNMDVVTTMKDNSIQSKFVSALFKIFLIVFIAIFFISGFSAYESKSQKIEETIRIEYNYSNDYNIIDVTNFTSINQLKGLYFYRKENADFSFIGSSYNFELFSNIKMPSLVVGSVYNYNGSLINDICINNTYRKYLFSCNYDSSNIYFRYSYFKNDNYYYGNIIFDNSYDDDFYYFYLNDFDSVLSISNFSNFKNCMSFINNFFIVSDNLINNDNKIEYQYQVKYNNYDWSFKLQQLSNLKPIIDSNVFVNSAFKTYGYSEIEVVSQYENWFNSGKLFWVQNGFLEPWLSPQLSKIGTQLSYDSRNFTTSELDLLTSDIGVFVLKHYKPTIINGVETVPLIRRQDNINDNFNEWSIDFNNDKNTFKFGNGFTRIIYILTLPIQVLINLTYDLGILASVLFVW